MKNFVSTMKANFKSMWRSTERAEKNTLKELRRFVEILQELQRCSTNSQVCASLSICSPGLSSFNRTVKFLLKKQPP
jgi:hypothetical protein